MNLNPHKYSQGLDYHTFLVKINRCNGSCNTFNDFSNCICIPNKTGNLNLYLFNMTTRINKSKTTKKYFHMIVNVNLMMKNVI